MRLEDEARVLNLAGQIIVATAPQATEQMMQFLVSGAPLAQAENTMLAHARMASALAFHTVQITRKALDHDRTSD